MSSAVKAYLCKLAKRDAAHTPEDIERMKRERAECLASLPPRESGPVETHCTTQGAKRIFGTFHQQARIQCNSSSRARRHTKSCPRKTGYLKDAHERVAKYCTQE
jgi:hypothetical protein